MRYNYKAHSYKVAKEEYDAVRFHPLSPEASVADFRIDVRQSIVSPPIARHGHVSLAKWVVILLTADTIGFTLIGLLAFRICLNPLPYKGGQVLTCLACFLAAWIFASWTQNLYTRELLLSSLRAQGQYALVACAFTFGVVLLLGFALKFIDDVSRIWLLTWALSTVTWLVVSRLLWVYFLRRSLRRGKCVDRALVLVGPNGDARSASDKVERESRNQIAVVSVIQIPATSSQVSIDWVDEAVREGMIDRVIIVDFSGAVEQTKALVARLMWLAVDVTLIPNVAELQKPVLRVDRIGTLPAIDLASRPLTVANVALKRAEDLVLGCLILALTAPFFAVAALAIKLESPGPILFGQWREGYHNSVFRVWKFRTMYHNVRDERGIQQTSRNDLRVTRVGRILRRFSLDELPQLINVIRGEMSVVGPRPHALGMTSLGLPMTQVLEGYTARLRLKPGITGWAQVNGCRGEVDSHEKLCRRVSLDCYYIDHWSLSLDLWIIFRTLVLLPFDSTAY